MRSQIHIHLWTITFSPADASPIWIQVRTKSTTANVAESFVLMMWRTRCKSLCCKYICKCIKKLRKLHIWPKSTYRALHSYKKLCQIDCTLKKLYSFRISFCRYITSFCSHSVWVNVGGEFYIFYGGNRFDWHLVTISIGRWKCIILLPNQ